MIRNTDLLIQKSDSVMGKISSLLRNNIFEIAREIGAITPNQLCQFLNITDSELNNVMLAQEVSLSTFVKIVTALENEISVEKQQNTPHEVDFGINEPEELNLEFDDTENDNLCVDEMEHGLLEPQRQMVSGMTTSEQARQHGAQPIPLDALGKNELINLVVRNGWSQDININGASRGEIIQFLAERFREIEEHENEHVPNRRERRARFSNGHHLERRDETQQVEQSNRFSRLTEVLAREVENNPHLRDIVEQYLMR